MKSIAITMGMMFKFITVPILLLLMLTVPAWSQLSIKNSSGTTEVMRIEQNGQVGIGTTLLGSDKLTVQGAGKVNGDLTVTGNTALQIALTVGGAATMNSSLAIVGNLSKINNVNYTWPTSQTAGYLRNNGTGSLVWASIAGGQNNVSGQYVDVSVVNTSADIPGTSLTVSQTGKYFVFAKFGTQIMNGPGACSSYLYLTRGASEWTVTEISHTLIFYEWDNFAPGENISTDGTNAWVMDLQANDVLTMIVQKWGAGNCTCRGYSGKIILLRVE